MSDNTVEISDARDGPGAILRQAREAKGLDATAVAAMLHLSESKLYALEADDYDSLPEPVFIRGYLRNYARLLDEPVTPVLDAYARYNPTVEVGEQPPLDSHVSVEVGSNHGVVKLITAVIAAILIVLPLIWWWDNLELAAQKIVSTVTLEAEQGEAPPTLETAKTEADLSAFIPPPPPGSAEIEDPGKVSTTAAETKESEVTSLGIKPAIEPVEPASLKIEENLTGGDSLSIPIPPSAAPEVEEAVSVIKEIVKEAALVTPAKPAVKPGTKPAIKVVIRKPKSQAKPKPVAAAVASKGTVFEFIESSWVKVRDANNQVILIGEYKKGQKKKLSGRTPYKVVLGNSTAVRVKINGKAANLDKYSSGGVARFTIMSGKIQSP